MDNYFNLFLGCFLGFLLCFNFFIAPYIDDKEKECYQFYKENNGYILNSCKKYSEKWSDFHE